MSEDKSAPTLEQIQRDRDLIERAILSWGTGAPLTPSGEIALKRLQDRLAPLTPESKTVRVGAGYTVSLKGDSIYNYASQSHGVAIYSADDIRALASLLPENTTPAAQPAPSRSREMTGDSVKDYTNICACKRDERGSLRVECIYHAHQREIHTLADELEQARRELGELSQTLLARDKALEASYHELTALRASLPAERRKAAEAGIWAAFHQRHGTSCEARAAWLNENYPKGET